MRYPSPDFLPSLAVGPLVLSPAYTGIAIAAPVLAVLVVFTATAPMMTWFGSGWQLVFLKAHRCVTVCFLAMAAWMALTGGRKE